jgi:glyoxylase-like metal-dependent hydrolase (beta-lactamase superfamily II)
MSEAMILEVVPVGPLGTNAYLVGCPTTRQAALIDPGDDAPLLLRLAGDHELTVSKVLLTHGHVDHVGAVGDVKRLTHATVYLHDADRPLYDSSPLQARMFGIRCADPPPPDEALEHGQAIEIGALRAEVIATPGHSPGGVSLHFRAAGVLFSGDTLFQGGIGRTDLPGGSMSQLMLSIRERLLTLPGETRVYCGHGPATTIGDEKRSNPFLT